MANSLYGRDLLSLNDWSPEEVALLLQLAAQLKAGRERASLQGRVLGLLFRKASTRTRVSFAAAIAQCGGSVLDLMPTTMQVSRGEPIRDTARILSGYLDALAIRTFDQTEIEEFAEFADIPIINALTDLYHPCQILADLLTIREVFGQIEGLTLTYCGDGNNIVHSLLLGGALTGMNVRVATPTGFEPKPEIVERAKAIASSTRTGSQIDILSDPVAAAEGAQVLYTDVWASMGQEALAESRIPIFEPYQLNESLLARADAEAIVLHCLPAHRGEEITDEVMEGPRSRVWQQAENRLHAQKALLVSLMTDDG
ncbi:ornithine carbamoyltransferase [Synechococcus sp. PCC 7336]|uniref:ornithine carbamoyltransferase n=1 Tax=Synechococcus sp. PCC 7336 TaxID=195250 RepID=UPI00034C4DAB|nr:ornithine carbamoyltransferase [Synechococcus sp. PCC 7336]